MWEERASRRRSGASLQRSGAGGEGRLGRWLCELRGDPVVPRSLPWSSGSLGPRLRPGQAVRSGARLVEPLTSGEAVEGVVGYWCGDDGAVCEPDRWHGFRRAVLVWRRLAHLAMGWRLAEKACAALSLSDAERGGARSGARLVEPFRGV
jgi:hypothetical protein